MIADIVQFHSKQIHRLSAFAILVKAYLVRQKMSVKGVDFYAAG